MKKITTLEELHDILLEELVYLDRVCRKNGLKYFMVDGTLLGAVRHKGFIPWDDDVDVWMPREDYDKLAEVVNGDDSYYEFQTPQNVEGFVFSYGKLVDTRTGIEEQIADIKREMGVFIDVFPYDGLPEPGTQKYDKFVNKCMFLQSQRIPSLYAWKQTKQRRNASLFGLFAHSVRKTVGCTNIVKLIDKNARTYAVKDSKMVGCLGGGYKKDQMMEKEICESVTELEFEGHKLYAPVGYERYLKKLYGDYMQLPPEEDQVIKHMSNVWWK